MGYRKGELLRKEDYLQMLRGLDVDFSRYLAANALTCNLCEAVITGGSALVLHGCLERATKDVDFIELSNVLNKYLRTRQDKILNSASQVFLYNFPEDFLDRIVPVAELQTKIRYYLVSLEDLVVSKMASYRDKDIQDVRNPEVVKRLDFGLLDRLIEEKAETALNKTAGSILRAMYRQYLSDPAQTK